MPTLTTTGTPTFNGDGSCTIDATGSDKLTAPSTLLSQTQGWLAFRVRATWSATGAVADHYLFDWGPSAADYMSVYFTASADRYRFEHVQASTVVRAAPPAQAFAADVDMTIVAYWKVGQVAIGFDGTAFNTIAIGGVSAAGSAPTFAIGSEGSATSQFDGRVWWMAAGSGLLTEADNATFNAFGNADVAWSFLPGTPTYLWIADSTSYLDAIPAPVPGYQ